LVRWRSIAAPGVRVARELVDIPVIGPLEASMQMAGYFGHSYTIVTDHHKAVPYMEDQVRLGGARPTIAAACAASTGG
jgi:allantoin racemase